MKVILMNKNTEVFSLEYFDIYTGFDKVYEIININYAPIMLKTFYKKEGNSKKFLDNINEWFRSRKIPDWRDNIDLLLHRLNISSTLTLIDKSFGLSLSDQYWIKPINLNINYDDINFFDNNFDYLNFMNASLSLNCKTIYDEKVLKTPNNTTDGMLKKAWIIDKGTRYLLKGGYKNEILQPFNEVLASMICERLGFEHVEYTLDTYKNLVVSKCPCFINKDTELITAYQIRNNMKRNDNTRDYEDYIKVLEKKGIKDARIKLENMFILDFLIMNEDRHLNNFGIIRNVNTLKWLDVAPIFDNGMALNIEYYDENKTIDIYYKFKLI